ncbi:MAG: hypothetical protein F4074_06255 [Synechococcus sp. SB0672_bin_10]|nr:hypothetical protein [Synechococcus sp. SB0672_bin_10]
MTAALQGKVLADKGYLSQSLLERLWQRGLHLVTGIRRTMINHLLEHTRHRSPSNVLVHILSCLAETTLTQPKGNIGKIPIPPMDTIPCPSWCLSTTRVPQQLSSLSPVACFLTNRLLLRSVTFRCSKVCLQNPMKKSIF